MVPTSNRVPSGVKARCPTSRRLRLGESGLDIRTNHTTGLVKDSLELIDQLQLFLRIVSPVPEVPSKGRSDWLREIATRFLPVYRRPANG